MKYWIHDKKVNLVSDLKRIHTSLTMWFNSVVAGVASFLLALPVDAVISYMPQFQPYISDEAFRTAMQILILINGINIALRFKTTKALRDK